MEDFTDEYGRIRPDLRHLSEEELAQRVVAVRGEPHPAFIDYRGDVVQGHVSGTSDMPPAMINKTPSEIRRNTPGGGRGQYIVKFGLFEHIGFNAIRFFGVDTLPYLMLTLFVILIGLVVRQFMVWL